MPVYEYVCAECGAEKDRYYSGFNPEDVLACRECDGYLVRKLSVPGYIKLSWKPSHRQLALTRPNRER